MCNRAALLGVILCQVAVLNGAQGARRSASPAPDSEVIALPPPFGVGQFEFTTKWDPWSGNILMYRGRALKGEVAIKILSPDGRVHLALKPFDDLRQSGVNRVSIWDAVVRRDGGVSYVAVVIYDSKPSEQPRVTQLMAHYSSSGVLTRVWDMHPYHHHLIASDRQNNIYAFGHRVTGDTTAPYPILLQYSATGSVRSALLTAAEIGESRAPDEFVDGNVHELLSVDDGVILLLRGKNELFEFRAGRRVRRSLVDLAGGLLARSKGEEIAAAMLTAERGGSGFFAYAFVAPSAPPPGSPPTDIPVPKMFLRIQAGLTNPKPVELTGERGATPRGRLVNDGGDYLRFVTVDADGTVKIASRSKVTAHN